MEQEIASVAKFVLDNAGALLNPFYYDVPESFAYPAAYFPRPEITTRGDTLNTYAFSYAWFPLIFCETTEEAYDHALAVLTALKYERNLVPLMDAQTGKQIGARLRIDDPQIKTVDRGAVQIGISWDSRRPYKSWDECVGQIVYITQPHLKFDTKERYSEGG